MICVSGIYMNNSLLRKSPRYRITEDTPRFSWSVLSTRQNAVQSAYSLQVAADDGVLWDTGWVETDKQEAEYAGPALPADRKLTVCLTVRDDHNEETPACTEDFYVAGLTQALPGWIAAAEDIPQKAVYFRKEFTLTGEVKSAVLYVCGLGYQQVWMNGTRLGDAVLDPIHADYARSCYYVMLPEIQEQLKPGANCLSVVIGDGWRRTNEIVSIFDRHHGGRRVAFMGLPQMSASLRITYTDGRTETVASDKSWQWAHGPIVHNSLFGGETYDAGQPVGEYTAAVAVEAPGGEPRVMTVEPIVEKEIYVPKTITRLEDGACLIDFGVNIAGYSRIRLPKGMQKGQTISLLHAEMLGEDGDVFLAPLRGTRAEDIYIAAGDERDLAEWSPIFNYHGFRYVRVTGWPLISDKDIVAVSIRSDVDNDSFFTCGSPIVNAIQKNLMQTERDNIVGILTDCPQRDERQGWMNDATVRFEETSYNFNIARLFPKVIQDILDTQAEDGSITCTAPFAFGDRPADVVCSTFLVAALESLLHTGNVEAVRLAYEGIKKWEAFLGTQAVDHIVQYSRYGDWAGPAYACWGGHIESANSEVTPGIFMSTGYYYYNAVLISRFATLLGKEEERLQYERLAADIRAAMLREWWDDESGIMATGSQGCQCFALWLGIIPEEKRVLAAQRLHEDLVEREYRFTTGNLCTRYLYDILTEYGYIEDAWKLITREEYPSIGYMIQNEATTVWERFELKKSDGMNSHNHPMYGAVGYWFYAYLAGIRPVEPGYTVVDIRPYFPQKLLSVQAKVDTPRGALTVHWMKRYGKAHLHVQVPFGVTANVTFDGRTETVGSGFWTFEAEDTVR